MGKTAVFVNGIPGAGKTTLARSLARHSGLPMVAKDDIKEALADAVRGPLPTSRLGALASDAMWELVGMMDGPVLVESFWASGRDEAFFARGLEVAGVGTAVEVWCEVPRHIARARFLQRPRHQAHSDQGRIEEWDRLTAVASPISRFPVIRVDTGGEVDVIALYEEVLHTL